MKKVILLFFMTSFILYSQNKKEVIAKRILTTPKIDGILNEECWFDVKPAQDFVMLEPYNGKIERSSERTEVVIVYDDNALYIGAKLYDQNSHLILEILHLPAYLHYFFSISAVSNSLSAGGKYKS